MPPRLTDEKSEALRAWITYYRDLGIYDLFRREGVGLQGLAEVEGPEPVAATEAEIAPATPAGQGWLVESSEAVDPLESGQMSPRKAVAPQLFPASELQAPVEIPNTVIPAAGRPAALQAIREEIGDCRRCPLCEQRNKIVFGDGDANAALMFVGEGPGADEDAQGLPFVGRGGQLLNNMIQAMGLKREQVYIANIVKCRPPQNRTPEPLEANTCTPFLLQQIDVVRPRMIVALGATAATYLLGVKSPLSVLRGRVHDCRSSQLVVTYHPAYLLRDPRQKAEAWKDLQLVMKFLGMTPPKRDA